MEYAGFCKSDCCDSEYSAHRGSVHTHASREAPSELPRQPARKNLIVKPKKEMLISLAYFFFRTINGNGL